MRTILLAFTAVWYFIAPTFLGAQTIPGIYGSVAGPDQKPAEAATVMLSHATDSVVIKAVIVNEDGQFQFTSLAKGDYCIRISLIGFKNYKSNVITYNGNVEMLPVIVLQQSDKMLNEVSVVAKRPLVVHKQDRTIVNVDAMTSGAGSSALDILEKSPGVQVDQDGKISLKGKQGVTIYIDDKPTYLSGTLLENYLRSLPSSSLDQIEIMVNPSAKYDAAGNGGIINIKTKKNNDIGFNGSLNLGITQGQMTRSNNSFNINYRKNRFGFFANLSDNIRKGFFDLDLNRTYMDADKVPNGYFEQNSYAKSHGNTLNLKTGIDYYQSDKTTWGIVFTGMKRRSTQLNDNTSTLFNQNHLPDSLIVAKNDDRINFGNGGINLSFRTNFDQKGHSLSADADWLVYRNQTEQVYRNFSYLPNGTPKTSDILTGHLPNDIDIYSIKTDYTKPLFDDWQLGAGLKSSYARTDNIADYLTTVGETTTPDYDKSNHFTYNENINAAYLNVNREGKQLSVQAGLRFENTTSDGRQLGNVMKPDSSFNRNYNSLFPTLYISYKLDTSATHQIGVNYGRRIDRPYYQDLNPFLYPIDKFTYYSGNPFLKPAFTQSIEISHTYKNKITTTFNYSRIKDNNDETIEITNGIYYSRPGNIGRKITKTISVDGTFDPLKWLNLHVYSEFSNITSKSSFYTGRLNTSGNYWFINGNTRISLSHGWDLEMSGNYRTRLYDAQFIIESMWQMNAGFQKKISSKLTLKANVNDIFRSRITRGTITNLSNAEASWLSKSDSRNVTFSLSYRFGGTINNLRKHDSSGAESEQNRVKN